MKNIKTIYLLFGNLIEILNAKQRRQGICLFLLLICVSLLEMLGVSVVIPFILVMIEPGAVMENRYGMTAMKVLHIQDEQQMVLLTAVGVVLIYVIKNAVILGANYYQINFRNTLEKDLSVQMLLSYMKRPYAFFLDTNSAEVLQGMNGDIVGIATILDNFSTLMAEGMTCVFLGIMLMYMSPFIAFFLLLTAAFTAIVIVLGFRRRIAKCGIETRHAFEKKYQHAYQAVSGIKEITVMQRRNEFTGQYERAAENARKYNNIYLFLNKTPSRVIETVFLSALVILVCINMNMEGAGADYVSVLGALAVAAVRILPSISSITNAINSLVYNRPALEAAHENIMQARKYDKTMQKIALKQKNDSSEKRMKFEKALEVKSISWRYKENLPFVLKNLSLEVHKGEAVALIGESGAGKTTLADVILGLFQPESGKILMDGIDIYARIADWAKVIGYVPQTVFLIDDTIRNNIVFGLPENEIDDKKVWDALEQAQLKEVVLGLEAGLDTILGERGVKFSGGQRQRIAIARALYYNPDILVLDEATSALDTDTETAVMEAIDALQGTKTLIIVAHRLTTVRNCDKIYEIRDGKARLVSKGELFHEQ